MAKTFDNISEASATTFLFLFAQRTIALKNEPPAPPPLNVLGLPCEAIQALLKCRQRVTVAQKDEANAEELAKAEAVAKAAEMAKAEAMAKVPKEMHAIFATILKKKAETEAKGASGQGASINLGAIGLTPPLPPPPPPDVVAMEMRGGSSTVEAASENETVEVAAEEAAEEAAELKRAAKKRAKGASEARRLHQPRHHGAHTYTLRYPILLRCYIRLRTPLDIQSSHLPGVARAAGVLRHADRPRAGPRPAAHHYLVITPYSTATYCASLAPLLPIVISPPRSSCAPRAAAAATRSRLSTTAAPTT